MRRTVLLLLILFTCGMAAAIYLAGRFGRPFKGYDGPEQFVEIPPGSPVSVISQRLVDAGVVSDRLAFRYALWVTGESRRLQAGEYRFDRPMPPTEVVRKLARGDVFLRPITFPEGLTIREMAALFEKAGLGDAAEFTRAAGRKDLVASLDSQAPDLEGYLFPDTYTLPRRATADRLIELMVAGFEKAFDETLRADTAARGLSVREAVTLASLVEEETAKPEERPLVAAVYANRLKMGMGLQCDPTVIYALQRAGRFTGNIRREDLQIDSPYNTYRYAGLPPGPIASPGRASLEAAVRPADVPYIYFVSRNDGSHEFAATLQEHNANVEKWQRQYFRERRPQGSSSSPRQ
ncbi:MAG: endolytic transglycosylase MltG [Vicinamibacterales bacterium]